jgi:hypothetical protein
MKIDTPLHANYEVELSEELPASGLNVRYFPPIDAARGQIYESSLKFSYGNLGGWWGVFAASSKRSTGLSIASTMPDPDRCIVASYGTGYVVNVKTPEDWQVVKVDPVLQLIVVSDDNLILLSDFTSIVAYGREGLKWQSGSLCSDQLEVKGPNGKFVACTGWDAAKNSEVSFSVDMLTGKIKSGK